MTMLSTPIKVSGPSVSPSPWFALLIVFSCKCSLEQLPSLLEHPSDPGDV